MSTPPRIEITIPTLFGEDHLSRDLVRYSGARDEFILRHGARTMTLLLDPRDAVELVDSARICADEDSEVLASLRRSARVTLNGLYQRFGVIEISWWHELAGA